MREGGPGTYANPTIDVKIPADTRRTHPHDENLGRPHAFTIAKWRMRSRRSDRSDRSALTMSSCRAAHGRFPQAMALYEKSEIAIIVVAFRATATAASLGYNRQSRT